MLFASRNASSAPVGAVVGSPVKLWKSPPTDGSKTDLPSGRMKFWFCGSRPSAIHATFTPAPVMPSDAAVGSCGSYDAVWVRLRPSGASCGVLLHAPGITLGDGVADVELPADAAGIVPSKAPWIVTSGMTWAMAGLAVSRVSSPEETVAATALMVRSDLTWVACT